MKELDEKINETFVGRVVRKDLTSLVKGNMSIPTYVLEYLLGQYCATSDEETIKSGVETVRGIITKHFVHRDEANEVKFRIKDKGSYRIIDKVAVKLNEQRDRTEASFVNLGLKGVPINMEVVRNHRKLLTEGIWCIVTLNYDDAEWSDDPMGGPPERWVIDNLKPIQISNADVQDYKTRRADYSKEEWIDFLMQSIGLNPEGFSDRGKLIQLTRLVPFAENNFNLIELGPKGTGKSHIYSEMSPHGILISGGEVSKAKLFINNSNGQIGLVGYWDVVAYDEFAGRDKKADRGMVDIMKNYMANRSFSRGSETHQAEASMVFVGNTEHGVAHMLKHSDLFESLPKAYYDTAFLDRIHCYLPGWEVRKLRNDMFTEDFGFIVDYLAEVLKGLRKEDHTKAYLNHFELSPTISQRDKMGIEKTLSGLIKVIYPHGDYTAEDCRELLDFAMECRKRVKDQLIKMDETFADDPVHFSFTSKASGQEHQVETLELRQFGAALPQLNSDSDEETLPFKQTAPERGLSPAPDPPKALFGGHIDLVDGQTGVSYKSLFGDYVRGASNITVCDPYIRLVHQLRNFAEFCAFLAEELEVGEELDLHLITSGDADAMERATKALGELTDSMLPLGIRLTFEYDGTIHDRYILSDTGWRMNLGRGLDIWNKTSGYFDIAAFKQEHRTCKASGITIIRD